MFTGDSFFPGLSRHVHHIKTLTKQDNINPMTVSGIRSNKCIDMPEIEFDRIDFSTIYYTSYFFLKN